MQQELIIDRMSSARRWGRRRAALEYKSRLAKSHYYPSCASTRSFHLYPCSVACACLALEELGVVFAEKLFREQLQQREARQREREPIKSSLSRKLHPD
jgi:hypothetical protein